MTASSKAVGRTKRLTAHLLSVIPVIANSLTFGLDVKHFMIETFISINKDAPPPAYGFVRHVGYARCDGVLQYSDLNKKAHIF